MAGYFLTDSFAGTAPTPQTPKELTFLKSKSSAVSAQAPTQGVNDFKTVTRQVIAYLEGGYYNPLYHNIGDPRYNTSGETLFGIDKLNGGTINTTPSGISFWKKITDAQAQEKWPYGYIPPDPLQKELVGLATDMISPLYEQYKRIWIANPEVIALVNTDGRLQFNFIYATWNGPGWFKGFARDVVAHYNKGNKTSDALVKFFVNRRINNAKVLGPNQKQNSLISQTGAKIKKLLNIV